MLQNPITLVARMPRIVRLLLYGTLVNKLGTFILPFLTLVLVREFRLSGERAGALVMAYGIGSLVSLVSGGVLTDRLGRRQTLLLSLFGSGILAVLMGCAQSASVFIPILLMYGFLADLYRPASSTIIGDQLSSEDRPTGFAALRVAVNLGFAFGAMFGGLLVDWNWRVLFVADGTTTLLFGVMVARGITETRPVLLRHPAAVDPPSVRPWRDGVFLRSLTVSVLFALSVFSYFTVLPLTITQSAGYPAWVYGVLVGVNGLLIALFEISIVAWLRRFRRLRVAALGCTLSAVSLALMGFIPHWSWFLLAVLLWTAGEILTLPQQLAFITDWAPPHARGTYLGLYGATWSLGLVINPILFLPLHARLPEPAFWPIMLIVLGPAIPVLLRLNRTADHIHLLRGRSGAIG